MPKNQSQRCTGTGLWIGTKVAFQTLHCYCVCCELLSASIADTFVFVNIIVSGKFHGSFAQRLAVNKPCLQIVITLLFVNMVCLPLRELADTDFASVQNFVKLGLYLKKWYDKQQASWEVQILKFRNWICQSKLNRSGLDLLPFFQVLPSSAMVFTLIFRNSCSQNLRSFVNILPKLDFTKFWRNTKCLCAETLSKHWILSFKTS